MKTKPEIDLLDIVEELSQAVFEKTYIFLVPPRFDDILERTIGENKFYVTNTVSNDMVLCSQ